MEYYDAIDGSWEAYKGGYDDADTTTIIINYDALITTVGIDPSLKMT